MTVERSPYTKSDIERAERREGITHPVLDVFEASLPRLIELRNAGALITNTQEQQRFIYANYGFLADDIVTAGPFTLESLELVAIWSRANEIFGGEPGSGYHMYALAGMVAIAYAIQGLDNPEFKKLPRHVVERDGIPGGLLQDKNGLRHVRGRLDQVEASIDDLDFYVYGTREPIIELAAALAERMSKGDSSAVKRYEELMQAQRERATETIRRLGENFGNGMAYVRLQLSEALDVNQE